MENGCNDQRSATGSWHQDTSGLLHPRLIANSDRPERQNTRSILTCLNIQDTENTEGAQRRNYLPESLIKTTSAVITPRDVTRPPSFNHANAKILPSSKFVNCFGAPPSMGCPHRLSMPPL